MKYDKRALGRLMRERKLKSPELARAAGVTEMTVKYIARGFTEPRASTLAKIANALGVSVTEFFKAA